MTQINTNVQSLLAQRVLGQNNKSLTTALERLSTGLRINRGADDPAGLIASENLRAEKTALNTAISNAERAEQVVNIAEGGLTEVSSLLNELEGLVTATANTAGLSSAEKEANQLQIDSILQTIDRVAASTSFQGSKLLNGNFDYATTSVDGEVANFKVNGAKLEFGDTRDVDVVVTNSAQVGGFFLSFGGANLDLGSADDQFVLEISGREGSRELSFASGTALTDVADQINAFTDVTGVSATVSGNGVRLDSTSVGSDEFVSVKVVDEGGLTAAVGGGVGIYNYDDDDTNTADTTINSQFTATAATNGVTDEGQDVEATINGIEAVTKGATASINTDFLNVEIELTTGAATANSQNLGVVNAFTITGGGADFQLAGEVNIAGKVSLGIGNVATRSIGRAVDGANNYTLSDLAGGKALNVEDGDITVAQKAVRQAIEDVSSLRGRLGAFQSNVVGATIRSLGVAFENTTAAESAVRDADFAAETAALTRAQILTQSTTNVLGIANSQPQNVLSLLG
jgi:flagellin